MQEKKNLTKKPRKAFHSQDLPVSGNVKVFTSDTENAF